MYDELSNKLYHCANEVFCNKCFYSPDCAGEKTIIRESADAIEELQKQLQKSEEDNVNLTGWLAEEHARAEEAKGKNMKYMLAVANQPRWISVTERLPEKDQTVLAYCAEDNFCYISRMHQSFEDYDVTHWIPLPQMPESEEP